MRTTDLLIGIACCGWTRLSGFVRFNGTEDNLHGIVLVYKRRLCCCRRDEQRTTASLTKFGISVNVDQW